MLPKNFRLARRDDISRALKANGLKNVYFSLKILKNNLAKSRFGFIVPKHAIKKTTSRNLIKRRAREIVRKNIGKIKKGYDVLFIFSGRSAGAPSKILEEEIFSEFSKARLLN